jgi:ubiquinone/menaquinone biosynthesis C-methylase UbiE
MTLNKTEFLFVNNPIRNLIQEMVEIRFIERYSSIKSKKVLLEMGCSIGNGTHLIKKHFSPRKIYAIDVDKKAIDIAKVKNKDKSIAFQVGDATKLNFENNKFDAVFEFTMIHHLKNWKSCIKEVRRVLKLGGEFIIDDFSSSSFQTLFGKFLNKILEHKHKIYTENEFYVELENTGFKIMKKKSYYPGHFIIIAKKI